MPEVTQIKVKNVVYDIQDLTSRQRSIPSGGTAGQVIVKNSSTNYDASWQTLNTISDAPSDNNLYVRSNGAWVALPLLDEEEF